MSRSPEESLDISSLFVFGHDDGLCRLSLAAFAADMEEEDKRSALEAALASFCLFRSSSNVRDARSILDLKLSSEPFRDGLEVDLDRSFDRFMSSVDLTLPLDLLTFFAAPLDLDFLLAFGTAVSVAVFVVVFLFVAESE